MSEITVGSRVVYSLPSPSGGLFWSVGDVLYADEDYLDVDAELGIYEDDVEVDKIQITPRKYRVNRETVKDDTGRENIIETAILVPEDATVNEKDLVEPYRDASGDWIFPIVQIPWESVLIQIEPGENAVGQLIRKLWGRFECFKISNPKQLRVLNNFTVTDPKTGETKTYKKEELVPKHQKKQAVKVPYYFGSAYKMYSEIETTAPDGRKKTYKAVNKVPPRFRDWDNMNVIWKQARESLFLTKSRHYNMDPEVDYWFTGPGTQVPKINDTVCGFRYNHPDGPKLGIWFLANETFQLMLEDIFRSGPIPKLKDLPLMKALEYDRSQEYYAVLSKLALDIQRARQMIEEFIADPETGVDATDMYTEFLNEIS